MQSHRRLGLLAALVFVHALIAVVHGAAHSGAEVTLSPIQNAFVLVVIMAGPFAGVAIAYAFSARAGSWIVALTMAGALLFGAVNHFIIASPDHVLHVPPPWQLTFGATAVTLAASEALGTALGVWRAMTTDGRTS